MRAFERLGACLFALFLAGCATRDLDLAPDRPDRPWNAPVRAGEIIAAPASPAPPSAGYVLPPNPAMAKVEPPPTLQAGHAYTLDELIDLAESHDPQTRIAWDEARDAALATGVARSAFLPELTASLIGGAQGGHQERSLAGAQGSGTSSGAASISAVSLKWLLFDFGGRDAMLDAAKQGSVISNIGFTAAHQNLIYRVSLAFYADAAARARQATAKQTLIDAQAVQAAADARYAHGEGTVVEAAQARQAAAQADYARIRADGAAAAARQALINAMGVPPTTRLTVADIPHRELSAEADGPIDELVSAALSRRPDVLAAYAARKASLAKIQAAKAEFMPKVFLSASGGYTTDNLRAPVLPGFGSEGAVLNLSGDRLGGTVLLGVTVPLFDGGLRAANLKRARIDADRADQQLSQVRNEAARQVVSAGTELKTSVAAYHAAAALVAASQTSFDSALAAYKHGVGAITDVTVAESKLLDARNTATDTYSNALSAAAGMAFTAGALGTAPPE
ncbi:TolC family protein [Phenylobacterium sp.]|jgi:outer membrane protein TolC|uniref:TolC family protein n=1 Tax=Phenylobacterium sp. TaxID=1871053 RepID=UPI002E30C636|nr:TolC family protein [Phenylobacterium sp.]HEX3364149.1 TolC family protein [Phenylobacterium sp.]